MTEETKTLFSFAEIRANIARQDFEVIPDEVVLALVRAASVAQRRILGEYAPGVALPSSADYEALREALLPFEFDRTGE